jgi:ABC-2 type transport system permease protein
MAVLASVPDQVMKVLQMNAFNLTTLSGFFGVMYLYFALMVSIFAVNLGNGIIAKEERDKTVEFALTMPITRARLITFKVLAALVHCVLFVGIIWGLTVVLAQPYNPDQEFYGFIRLGMVALLMLEVIFLAFGVLLGAAMKDYKRSGSVAVSLLLVTYVLSVIADLSDKFDFLKYFTPFKYFNPLLMLTESRFEMPYVWLSAGIVVVCLAAAYITYQKRDLYI